MIALTILAVAVLIYAMMKVGKAIYDSSSDDPDEQNRM